MSRIGIDVDGVLRDFCGSLVSVVKDKYPHYLKDEFKPEIEPSLDGGMITEWYLANNFTCTKKELQEIYWKDHAHTIMGDGQPMYGAIKKMYDLFDWAEENDHTLVCITSQKAHARHYTLTWLGKYGMNFDTVYFRRGREKWKVDVDYLVDDSPNNFNAWIKGRGMEEGFVLMDAPYNQHLKSNFRIKGLDQVKDIVK